MNGLLQLVSHGIVVHLLSSSVLSFSFFFSAFFSSVSVCLFVCLSFSPIFSSLKSEDSRR